MAISQGKGMCRMSVHESEKLSRKKILGVSELLSQKTLALADAMKIIKPC